MDRFPELCVGVHMAEEYNAAQFLTVNVTLHFLFHTYGSLLPEKADEYFRLSRLCAVNTETALTNLPLHLPATDDVIIALSFGVRKLPDNPNPTYCSPVDTLARPIMPSSLRSLLWLGSCRLKHPTCVSLSAIIGVRHLSMSPRRMPSPSSSSSGACTPLIRAWHFAWGGHRRYKITMSPYLTQGRMGSQSRVISP